jgi:hypothetical protein
MERMIRAFTLALVVVCSPALAGEPLAIYGSAASPEVSPYAHLNLSPQQLAAAHELEAAQYRLVSWLHFEFPAQLRALDAEITIAQEQLASFERRHAEFSRFNVWSGGGNPLFETEEDVRLVLVATRERLDQLHLARGQLLQQKPIAYRLRLMEVEQARANLRQAP